MISYPKQAQKSFCFCLSYDIFGKEKAMSKKKKPVPQKNFIEEHKTPIFIILFAVIVIMAIGLAICVGIYKEVTKPQPLPFTPPPFDESAVVGDPEDLGIGEEEGYMVLSDPTKAPFKAGICGLVDINENNEADIYFYNVPTNNVWLKIRIYGKDPKTDIVAETGLIKPGEYIKTVSFRREIAHEEQLTIKVMSYVPEEYTSDGVFVINPYVRNLPDAPITEN